MRSELWSAARHGIQRVAVTWLTLVSLSTVGIATASGQSTGAFTPTGTMMVARGLHTATLLPDGKVLLAGGRVHRHQDYRGTVVASAELYDPATGTFSATGSMTMPRVWHAAVLLPNGKVLIVGAGSDAGDDRSAEMYDPATKTFTRTGDTLSAQYGASLTLLNNGRVLVAGGITPSSGNSLIVSIPELYDWSAGTFARTGPFVGPGDGFDVKGGPNSPAVALLRDGRVLFAAEPFSEVYDPARGSFSETGAMKTSCGSFFVPNYISGRSATLLTDGDVLVAGGGHEDCGRFADAERYDPAVGTFTSLSPMTRRRTYHTATPLADGTVLIAGGESESGFSLVTEATAEIYDPTARTFAVVGSMQMGREVHTATLLKDGRVLLAGGIFYQDVGVFLGSLSSADLYTPATTAGPGAPGTMVAPVPVFPVDGAVTEDLRPRLQVQNVRPSRPSGIVTYRFDWSDRSDFGSSPRTSGADGVREGGGRDTAHAMTEDLEADTSYYWRARATLTSPDGTAVHSAYSEVRTFRTPSRGNDRRNVESAEAAGGLAIANATDRRAERGQSGLIAGPSHVVAAASGSGVVLTWTSPPGMTPVRYAISGGNTPEASNLPVVVTPDASTHYTIPSLPLGTYRFIVWAIFADSLSAPSNDAAVVVADVAAAASAAPGGVRVIVEGATATATWTAAPLATSYRVEIGDGPGLANVTVQTTTEPRVTYRPAAGGAYLRVRVMRGGMPSAPSNEVFASATPTACRAPAGAPILLPVSTTGGETTVSWLPPRGPQATHYRVHASGSAGRKTMTSHGTGTSVTGTLEPGEHTIRVVAINACGESAVSNSVSFKRRD